MRRNDFQAVASNGLPMLGSKSANLSAHTIHLEQGTTYHKQGDLWEEAVSHWESAWIDIGGEG
jgi:hypothetical protein